jgi:hypothetical protein
MNTDTIQEVKHGIYIGAIVNVQGYGGRAKVLNMEQDGCTPPTLANPQGHPKWLCSVVFGPYSHQTGTISRFNGKNNGQTAKRGTPGLASPIHQFYAGKLTNVLDTPEARPEDLQDKVDSMDKAALLARLAEINAKLGA